MNEDNQVSMDHTTPAQDAEPVGMDVENYKAPVDPPTASSRALKASYGLSSVAGMQSKSYEDINSAILSGREDHIRRQISSEIEFLKRSQEQDAILEIAKNKGSVLTPDEVQQVHETIDRTRRAVDPKSVFEDTFSRKYINSINDYHQNNDNSWWKQSMIQLPEATQGLVRLGEYTTAYREFSKTMEEDAHASVQQQSWPGYLADQAKYFTIPLYSQFEFKFRGGADFFGLTGNNLEDLAQSLLSLPYEQYKAKYQEIAESLKGANPSLFETFAHAVTGQSTSERHLNNFFGAADWTIVPGVGRGIASLGTKAVLWNQARRAIKDLVKSVEGTEVKNPQVASASGSGALGEAAVHQATADTAKGFAGINNPAKEAIEALPSGLRADEQKVAANPGRYGQEAVNRINETNRRFTDRFMNILQNIARVERVPLTIATEKTIRYIKDETKKDFPGISNAILDVTDPYRNTFTNTWHMNVIIGTHDAEYFGTKEAAENFAKQYGLINAQIDNRGAGAGWYIRLEGKPLDETSNVIRDYLMTTKQSQTPDSLFNVWLGWIRTPEETLSEEQRMARKVATYAPSAFFKVAKEEAQAYRKLRWGAFVGTTRRKRFDEWNRVINESRNAVDPKLKPGDTGYGEKGYFYDSPAELEDFYQRSLGRMPDLAEVEGYFAFKRMAEMDRVLRNVSLYRNMSRVGTQLHQFSVLDQYGQMMKSGFIPGVRRFQMPGGEDTMAIIGDEIGQEKLTTRKSMSRDEWETLSEEVKKGERVVYEIWDPESRPLSGFGKVGESRVRWVVAKNVETDNLKFDQIPRRGGGHFEYDYEYYIKQARIRPENIRGDFKHWYEGDTTVMPMSIKRMGQDVVKKLEDVRKLIKDNKWDEARELTAKTLPVEWKELSGWFLPKRGPDGKMVRPRLDKEEPFILTPRDKTIADLNSDLEKRYPGTFKDGTRSGSLARQYQVEYTGKRDAYEVMTMRDEGSRHNPLYRYEPAKLVDPIPTMNRALANVINSTWMDDYKISAMEHWIKEAAPHLEVKGGESALRDAPFFHFNNYKFKRGADEEATRLLEGNWHKIRQFTGIPSITDTFLNSMAQKLANSIYGNFGPKAFDVLSPWLLATTKDPFRFIRGIVFHAKMGLFSIPQFMVHAMTYVNVMGIAGPKNASVGALGSLLHFYASFNKHPEILKHLDGIASKMGFRPGEFLEAMEEVHNTGFLNEAGEYALKDNHFNNKIFTSAYGDFLHAGEMFFRGGVRSLRTGSWYTAYKEFRDLNPTGRITARNRQEILERADILSHNMTRASSSMLHKGILSIPAQFYTYFLRLGELMLGHRLTGIEKARLLGVNAAVFGIPTATSVPYITSPFGDMLREYAREHGYVVGDNFLLSMLDHGIPSAMGALITGAVTGKQTWFDFGERYGPKGQTVNQLLQGDKTFWDIFGGASLSTLGNAYSSMSGMGRAIKSMITGTGDFPWKVDDLVRPLQEIATVNSIYGTYAALNAGNLISKKGLVIDKMSPLNAIFKGLTGLQDANAVQVYPISEALKHSREAEKVLVNKFMEEMDGFFQAEQKGDHASAKEYHSRARGYLAGIPVSQHEELYKKAATLKSPMVDRVNMDYWLKSGPDDQRDIRKEAYKKFLRTRGQ